MARSTARATRASIATSRSRHCRRACPTIQAACAISSGGAAPRGTNHPNVAAITVSRRRTDRRTSSWSCVEGERSRQARSRTATRGRRPRRRRPDCGGRRGGARSGGHPPGSEASQRHGAHGRLGESPRPRPRADGRGVGKRPVSLADRDLGGNRHGRHPRDRGVHEPGAGSRPAGRSAPILFVRLACSTMPDGAARLSRRDGLDSLAAICGGADWKALPPNTPSSIRRLLSRASRRTRSAGSRTWRTPGIESRTRSRRRALRLPKHRGPPRRGWAPLLWALAGRPSGSRDLARDRFSTAPPRVIPHRFAPSLPLPPAVELSPSGRRISPFSLTGAR